MNHRDLGSVLDPKCAQNADAACGQQQQGYGPVQAADGTIGYSDRQGVVPKIRTEVSVRANNSFSNALDALKYGRKVTRAGWNGKGLWLDLQRPDRNSRMTLPYLVLNYPRGDTYPLGASVPWLASQTDMLADDWAILPDGAD